MGTHKIGIPIQFQHSEGVRHFPKSSCFLPDAEAKELMGALLVDSFGEKQEGQHCGQPSPRSLQIKNCLPTPVRDDNAGDEWPIRMNW
jgi:hypothetical protein